MQRIGRGLNNLPRPMPDSTTCSICKAAQTDGGILPSGGALCANCAIRLGMMLREGGLTLAPIFPALHSFEDDEDDDEPEPMVRRDDGSRVELRVRTEELKKDLTPSQRLELARTYRIIDSYRQALMELGLVLIEGTTDERTEALGQLFAPPFAAPDAFERATVHLLPV